LILSPSNGDWRNYYPAPVRGEVSSGIREVSILGVELPFHSFEIALVCNKKKG